MCIYQFLNLIFYSIPQDKYKFRLSIVTGGVIQVFEHIEYRCQLIVSSGLQARGFVIGEKLEIPGVNSLPTVALDRITLDQIEEQISFICPAVVNALCGVRECNSTICICVYMPLEKCSQDKGLHDINLLVKIAVISAGGIL